MVQWQSLVTHPIPLPQRWVAPALPPTTVLLKALNPLKRLDDWLDQKTALDRKNYESQDDSFRDPALYD